MQRIPIRMPLNGPMPPLCVHCKYYIPPPPHIDKKHGQCKKSGKVHVVDGEVTYENVCIVREYECKGQWYEDKK